VMTSRWRRSVEVGHRSRTTRQHRALLIVLSVISLASIKVARSAIARRACGPPGARRRAQPAHPPPNARIGSQRRERRRLADRDTCRRSQLTGKMRRPTFSRSCPVTTMSWATGANAAMARPARHRREPRLRQELEIFRDSSIEQHAASSGSTVGRRRRSCSRRRRKPCAEIGAPGNPA
jgi:hypothetical protein